MTSVASPAPSGATPADLIVVPLADLHLGTHEPGITAAVDEAYETIRASLEGALVTASARWQCFACDTWNEDAATECMVCGHDRYGFDTTQEAGR